MSGNVLSLYSKVQSGLDFTIFYNIFTAGRF